MRKAVRELLRERQPYSDYVVGQVDVKQLGVGLENCCFDNAVTMVENDSSNNFKLVSGWMVGEYDKSANGTALIQPCVTSVHMAPHRPEWLRDTPVIFSSH
jgi:hypothetical protein